MTHEPLRAVAIVDRAGADAGRLPVAAVRWSEGPLAVALTPGRYRALHVGSRIVCLLEGVLYAAAGAPDPPPAGQDAAAWLAAAYAARGEALLPDLRGEYWALLWDRTAHEGVLVCDQLAVGAPYWSDRDGQVTCASELRDLLAALPRRPPPDRLGLAHWLMRTVAPGEQTLYAQVARLPAAHLLRLRPGAQTPRRYWEPRYQEPRRVPRSALVDEVRAALEVAVQRRLRAAEAPGVLLSGGLDSSSVSALAAAQRSDLATYSAVFPAHPDVDESSLIDRTVRRWRLPSTRIVVGDAPVLAGALAYLRAWMAPPASPNQFFWIPLMQRAGADGTTVLLDGEGGDDVFGFAPYLLADRLTGGRLRRAAWLAAHWPGTRGRPPVSVVTERLAYYGLRGALPPRAHLAMRPFRGLDTYAPAWMPRELARDWLDSEDSAFAFKRVEGPRWWSYLVHAITRGTGPTVAFEHDRRRAELGGMQARHPLADLDLVTVILGCDPELAFDVRYNRPLLREAMLGMLDEEVRFRRGKSFFDAVFHAGLAGRDLPAVRELLDPADARLGAFIDARVLHRELFARPPHEHPEGLLGWALITWRAMTAECWLRLQDDGHFGAELDDALSGQRFARA